MAYIQDETLLLIVRKLRTIREEKRLTQEEVARKIGVSASQFSRLESGESEMSLPQFLYICHALGTTGSKVLRNDFVVIPEGFGS
jgi:transcriptional regulator with XRE-family HTH domain